MTSLNAYAAIAFLSCCCAAAQPASAAPPQATAAGTPSQPVSVREVGSRAWRFEANGNLNAFGVPLEEKMSPSFTVPAGKRLLIDHVSMHCGTSGVQPIQAVVDIRDAATQKEFHIRTVDLTQQNNIAVFLNQYGGAAAVQLGAEAGDVVTIAAARGNASFAGSCTGILAGRLIDLQ